MVNTLKWISLILVAAAVGLALAVLATAGVRAHSPSSTVIPRPAVQLTPYPEIGQWGSGPGMMRGLGTGWRSNRGPGIMGGFMGGMMGWRSGTGGRSYPNSLPLTLDQAVDATRQYLSAYGNPDLVLTEVMEFSENFYAEVEEESSGVHAFELLIDRYNGEVYPEPGPNMMWNTKYGHMGGMMGGRWSQAPDTISVASEQAQELAQRWLDEYLPGKAAAEQADAFFGYYTIHVLQDGQVFGMLSVNGFNGEVWYHDWHGDFVEMKDLEE